MITNNLPENKTKSLKNFVASCEKNYNNQLRIIPLFNPNLTQRWSHIQKQYFSKVFYHLRGHFHEFLWLLGNFSPDIKTKQVILRNIYEEFGESRRSHEQLYFDFAAALGVDLKREIVFEETYLEFARKFNKGHLEWLLDHCWEEKQAAFSAYERLDNIDYPYLFLLGKSLGLAGEKLIFFKVHIKVAHYASTESLLETIWQQNAGQVANGFHFIFDHQLKMWHNLSEVLFNYLP